MKKNNTNYPLKAAVRNMIEDVPVCYSNWNISDVKKMLFEKIKKIGTINYIYVIAKDKKLVGVFSIKEVFRRKGTAKVDLIMQKDLVKVRPYTDQERVAILALKNNLKAIPVVAKDDKFLGVVPSDVILSILHSENVEDFLRMAGIRSSFLKISKGSSLYLARVRIPWLILGLLGGILAAKIMNYFETPLKDYFILTSFVPLMLYLASAVGTQTETLFIRNLALDNKFSFLKYLLREINVGFLIAAILGFLLALVSIFWFGSSAFLGFIMAISLFLTILTAVLIGVCIPFVLQKFKKDPAIGTGPFATILRDIMSLVIYFSVSIFLLKLVQIL
ncbi:hypothetical protein AMJ47_02195 [Parcubacteria bacterium DG_72]|nr:MAG: hypothetical protein AMJ47_02195 [Parcubacteria bacterium DG_72]